MDYQKSTIGSGIFLHHLWASYFFPLFKFQVCLFGSTTRSCRACARIRIEGENKWKMVIENATRTHKAQVKKNVFPMIHEMTNKINENIDS
jgi:hypothetical protein